MVKSFVRLAHFCNRQGFQSKFHMLENESLGSPKRKIVIIGIIYQLVFPRLILEENIKKEIQTCNKKILLGMSRSCTNCTLELWYPVLSQENHPKYTLPVTPPQKKYLINST